MAGLVWRQSHTWPNVCTVQQNRYSARQVLKQPPVNPAKDSQYAQYSHNKQGRTLLMNLWQPIHPNFTQQTNKKWNDLCWCKTAHTFTEQMHILCLLGFQLVCQTEIDLLSLYSQLENGVWKAGIWENRDAKTLRHGNNIAYLCWTCLPAMTPLSSSAYTILRFASAHGQLFKTIVTPFHYFYGTSILDLR